MGLVLTATAFGVLVTSACTNVAGLTGYEFGDASGEGGPDARASDGAATEAGACKGIIDAGANTNPECAACAESKCCEALTACSGVVCLVAARANKCGGDGACQKLARCFVDKCTQCKS